MDRWLPLLVFFSGMVVAPQAFSQKQSSGSGVELTLVVQGAIDEAAPQATELSSKIWKGLDGQTSISQDGFTKRYAKVRTEVRHNAHSQLQRALELVEQLNTLNALVICAYEINDSKELRGLANNTLTDDHWLDVTRTWNAVSERISCVTGRRLRSQPGGLSSVIKDAEVRSRLDDTFTKVDDATISIDEAIRSKNPQRLRSSVSTLTSRVALFYVVTSVQVARLTKDITTMATGTLGPTSNPTKADIVLKKLEKLPELPCQE